MPNPSRRLSVQELRQRVEEASQVKKSKPGKPRKAFVKNPAIEIKSLSMVSMNSPNYVLAQTVLSIVKKVSESNSEIHDSDMRVLNNIALKINRAERIAFRNRKPLTKPVSLNPNQQRILGLYS